MTAAHGQAGEGGGAAVGPLGELAQAIEPKAIAPATSLRTTRAIWLLVMWHHVIRQVGSPSRLIGIIVAIAINPGGHLS